MLAAHSPLARRRWDREAPRPLPSPPESQPLRRQGTVALSVEAGAAARVQLDYASIAQKSRELEVVRTQQRQHWDPCINEREADGVDAARKHRAVVLDHLQCQKIEGSACSISPSLFDGGWRMVCSGGLGGAKPAASSQRYRLRACTTTDTFIRGCIADMTMLSSAWASTCSRSLSAVPATPLCRRETVADRSSRTEAESEVRRLRHVE